MKTFSKFALLVTLSLAPFAAFADATTGEVQGYYVGKVSCQSGKKVAEFKNASGGNSTFSTSEAIKRRIDTLTWHGSSMSESFSDREKEKTQLQKALKSLKNLDCDAVAVPTQDEQQQQQPGPLPPALLPHPQ